MSTAIKSHHFTLILKGSLEITDAMEDAVLAAGCDDALLWSSGRVVGLHFDREAESLGEAIGSAVNAINRAGYQVNTIEVEGTDSTD